MPPPQRVVRLLSSSPVIVTFAITSPHVLAYRLWSRPTNQAPWGAPTDGDTQDNVPDAIDAGAVPAGGEMLYWLGIGGNPGPYRALVTLDQDGQRLEGGTCVEVGNANGNGFAQARLHILLQ